MLHQFAGTALSALLLTGVPGRGHPGYAPVPAADVRLSYVAAAGLADAVELTCDPDGGEHPDPAAACRTLTAAGGDPDRLVAGDSACYLVYQPVTATLAGTWHGGNVAWRHTYGNLCEMRRATGVLFDF